ncbi:GNAT family N-acetyltransferase [Paenibacillus pasadenensis]|uniref:Erythrocyte binding protein n=1 Tax=Paenibacillus pasadenensis TaxID=217090 RepID=A0A2N5N9L4_9BACL|nr:GNAT family N-acetyltransferase [Paenibacillus pasadenensis]PLT47041.1 Erythrocyte binding protein [Paenibacillus pasadenensis]
MKAMLLTPKQWTRSREPLLRLMAAWGGGRLSAAGLAALKELRAEELETAGGGAPAAALAVLLEQGRPAGIAFARKAGREACLVAVSPPCRGRGAGSRLLRELQRTWGALDCRVAADNAASMKMCFRAGMAAVALEDGPTGKPTLVFRSGAGALAAQGAQDGAARAEALREAARIETAQVNAARSQAGRSEVERFEVERPQAERFETAWFEAAQPQAERSQVGRSEAERFEAAWPQAERSQVGRSEAERSEAAWPQAERSQVGRSQVGRSQVGRSEAGATKAARTAGAARTPSSRPSGRELLPKKPAAARRDDHGSAGARHLNVIPQ